MAKRLSPAEWADARAMREGSAASFQEIGKKFGVSDVAIHKRAKKEGWTSGRSLEPAIVQKALSRVYRDAAEKAAAAEGREVSGQTGHELSASELMEAEAAKRASVLLRHQAELETARALLHRALDPRTETGEPFEIRESERMERAKAAKVVIDALATLQTTERRAYGFATDGNGDGTPGTVEVVVRRIPRKSPADE